MYKITMIKKGASIERVFADRSEAINYWNYLNKEFSGLVNFERLDSPRNKTYEYQQYKGDLK